MQKPDNDKMVKPGSKKPSGKVVTKPGGKNGKKEAARLRQGRQSR